jgi:hypothetical protein
MAFAPPTKQTVRPDHDRKVTAAGDVKRVLANAGEPLREPDKAFMESRFGLDFSAVRVHHDAESASTALTLQANAFTAGNHIAFGAGRYRPQTSDGQRLLAHELAHVSQLAPTSTFGSGTTAASPAAEREAASAAQSLAAGRDVNAIDSAHFFIARDPINAVADPLAEARAAIALVALAEPITGIPPNDPVWSKLTVLWMVNILQLLERAAVENQLSALDRHVDSAGGGTRTRLRIAIDAVKMRLAGAPAGQVDPAFLARLDAMGDPQQTREVIEYVAGPAKAIAVIPIAAPGQPDFMHPPPANGAATAPKSVASLTAIEKISKAVDYAKAPFHDDVRKEIDALFTRQAIGLMAAFAAVYVAAQLTPAGWVADALALTTLTISLIFVGTALIDVIKELATFLAAINATSEAELKTSGEALARAIAKIEINLIIALLTHTAKGAAKPYVDGPPPGMADAITADGAIIRAPVSAIPAPKSAAVGAASHAAMAAPPRPATPKPQVSAREPSENVPVKDPAVPEDTHGLRDTPGGAKQAQATQVGHWVDGKQKNFERLRAFLPNEKNIVSEDIPSDAVPQYYIEDGSSPLLRPCIDRLDRTGGTVIEIKTHSHYNEGLAEAKAYAQQMDKFEPRADGKRWKAKCVTYDFPIVRAYLTKIGYLE